MATPDTERLTLLDDLFAEVSGAFYARVPGWLGGPANLAVDVGCGEGHGGARLKRCGACTEVVGLDLKPQALSAAHPLLDGLVRADASAGLPLKDVPLMACRFTLGQFPDPGTTLVRWMQSLSPGGLLLVEEFAGFATEVPALSAFMEQAEQTLRTQHQHLAPGSVLTAWEPPPGPDVVHRQTVTVASGAAFTARLCHLMAGQAAAPELAELQTTGGDAPAFTWHLLQLAVRHKTVNS